MHHPYLMLRFRLQGVVTVVDAINGAATLDAQEEAVKQVAVADRIVLTKTDLATTPEQIRAVADLRTRLAALAPAARIVEVADAQAANLLDSGLFGFEGKSPDVARWLNDEALAQAQAQPQQAQPANAHDPNRHDSRIRSFCLTSDRLISPATFDLFMDMLRNVHGSNMLRVKGLIGLSDDPARPVVIHGVQHVFHPPVRLDGWPDGEQLTRIVFILRDLEPQHVQGLWSAFLGEPAIDRPTQACGGTIRWRRVPAVFWPEPVGLTVNFKDERKPSTRVEGFLFLWRQFGRALRQYPSASRRAGGVGIG